MIYEREVVTENERRMAKGTKMEKVISEIPMGAKQILIVPEKKKTVQVIAKVNPEIKELLDRASEVSGKSKNEIIMQGIIIESMRLLADIEK